MKDEIMDGFVPFANRMRFLRDRRAYDEALNCALSKFYDGIYHQIKAHEFRRCRECEKPFDYLRGYTTALFCEPCLFAFDQVRVNKQ